MEHTSEEYENQALEVMLKLSPVGKSTEIAAAIVSVAQVYATLCLAAATLEAAAMPEPEKVPITDPHILGRHIRSGRARELKSLACTQYDAVRPPNHAACKMLICECECHLTPAE